LESLQEVPDSDVHVAEAQLQAAIANEQRAHRDYDINRIIEARIRLDHGETVAGLIDGRVTVVIQP